MKTISPPPQPIAKGLCPSCGSNDVHDDVMHESGEEYPISKCHACNWWGDRIKNHTEATTMAQKKQLPTKHRTKKTTKEQEKIIAHIQAQTETHSYLEAKHEYFENQDKYDKMTENLAKTPKEAIKATKADMAEEIAGSAEKEIEKEVKQARERKATMTIGETKLGVTMVLSKGDCLKLGYKESMQTKDAIKDIRAKLGLPEKQIRE